MVGNQSRILEVIPSPADGYTADIVGKGVGEICHCTFCDCNDSKCGMEVPQVDT